MWVNCIRPYRINGEKQRELEYIEPPHWALFCKFITLSHLFYIVSNFIPKQLPNFKVPINAHPSFSFQQALGKTLNIIMLKRVPLIWDSKNKETRYFQGFVLHTIFSLPFSLQTHN